jgi:hypothetical protein
MTWVEGRRDGRVARSRPVPGGERTSCSPERRRSAARGRNQSAQAQGGRADDGPGHSARSRKAPYDAGDVRRARENFRTLYTCHTDTLGHVTITLTVRGRPKFYKLAVVADAPRPRRAANSARPAPWHHQPVRRARGHGWYLTASSIGATVRSSFAISLKPDELELHLILNNCGTHKTPASNAGSCAIFAYLETTTVIPNLLSGPKPPTKSSTRSPDFVNEFQLKTLVDYNS